MLEREKKVSVIPSLILYHPSDAVVQRCLEIFARAKRIKSLDVVNRLAQEHASPRIRGAAIATSSATAFSEEFLRERLSQESAEEVRTVITVNLIAAGAIEGDDAQIALDEIVHTGSPQTLVALAGAIGRHKDVGFLDVLISLGSAQAKEVRVAATLAMGRVQHEKTLACLIQLLASEDTRAIARESILAFGSAGLKALTAALRERHAERLVRWQLPKAIALFPAKQASRVLLGNLVEEYDGMVRYRSIRALEGIIVHSPMLRLNPSTLAKATDTTLSRCYRYLDRRISLDKGAEEKSERKTPGHALLRTMLVDKEAHAFDRLFRLFNLAHPKDEYRKIFRSLTSARPEARVSSRELIENLLKPPLRQAVVGLVDDIPDEQRLALAGHYHKALHLNYNDLLRNMLRSSSTAVQDITVYHIGELRLRQFEEEIQQLARTEGRNLADINRTLSLLRNSPQVEGKHAH